MNDERIMKARIKFDSVCGKAACKLQKRISFGEVNIDYYPGDGICAEVDAEVVPLRSIPEKGKIDKEWWDDHAI